MAQITIVGTGSVGGPLATTATRTGHETTSITRATDASEALGALKTADLVFLALPYEAALDLPVDWKDALADKVVVDVTNPLKPDFSGLTLGFDVSGAERVAAALPKSSVVKALNAVLAPNHDPSAYPADSVFVPVASDDDAAKATVIAVLASLGFAPIDAGPLANARYIEPLAELLVQLAYFQNNGTQIALSLLRA
ncbi:NADPH-dependent F420 reductase [Tsukamurella strandjordii]|uniref:NAD(P)-binding domain-containing protein n=1 Tax=Tsukamurella strandjordii TaxID=147577 RepID=A0AA90S9G1_9ACTN|nr:NAD(P)-binding domain-containing protein [Tsukamurella strandjordii]MDP0400160.1 NAD(P)-binding domain-containing protein [Tsukamurella strandjordii]